MKVSDLKNEEALDALADMLEPAVEIMNDKEFLRVMGGEGTRAQAIKIAIKNHKKAVIQILAALERTPPEEYQCNILTLPLKLIELFNDKEVMSLFPSQGQKEEKKLSGSASGTSKAGK